MKILNNFFILFLITNFSVSKGLAERKQNSNPQENIEFSEAEILGKYQFSGETIVVVEDDKSLDNLIQIRKNFDDRTTLMKTRNIKLLNRTKR